MKQKTKMNIKNLMVSFVVLAGILLLTATASALSVDKVTVDGVDVVVDNVDALSNVALVAGDTVTLKVYFTADDAADFTTDATDDTEIVESANVKLKAELEGNDFNVDAVTDAFTVVEAHSYVKVLTLKVPYGFDDEELTSLADLNLKIWGKDFETTNMDFTSIVLVQRPSYNVEFASITTSNTAEAGKTFPVEFVLKNVGYNDLDNLYVTVSIPELEIQKSGYFGDLVSVANANSDDDKFDVVSGKILLDVPYTAKSGVYSLEVEAKSDDSSVSKVGQIVVDNGLSSNVFVTGNKIVIANPTTQLMVLKLVPESTGSVTLSEELVVVPAGASKTVTASATEDYTVNVFSKDGQLLESVTVPASVQTDNAGNAVAVLTVILTVVFLVLLVVLIVLITKKPEKTEEFSESYY